MHKLKIKSMKKVLKFKEYNEDVNSFLNFLEWNYKESESNDIDKWESDESYFWDEEKLELILWNEEFDLEDIGDGFDYFVYMDRLKNNLK